MIWHIFKKDARLLWWLAASVAALDFAKITILLELGLFPQNPRLYLLSQFLAVGELLGVGFAIAAVVQQDAIPGVRQDWLVRPIRRRDLLLAKLLFVVLMLRLPSLLLNFYEGLSSGFRFEAALGSAVWGALMLLLAVDIPFLAFASLTRNLLEAITGGVVIFFGAAILLTMTTGGGNRLMRQPTFGTGMEWITAAAVTILLLVFAAILLLLQFFRRRTFLSRCLTGVATVVGLLTTFIPWQPAFAIERSLSRVPGAAKTFALSFNPGAGRFPRGPNLPALNLLPAQELTFVFIPLQVFGLPQSGAIQSDHVEIRLVEANGRVDALNAYPQSGFRASAELSRAPQSGTYQSVTLPATLYHRLKDQPIRVEINYSLTLWQIGSSYALPATNADEHIPGLAWCKTRVNGNETAVQLRCEQAGNQPGCVTAVLEHTPSGRHNPERFNCEGSDYAPYPPWQFMPDQLHRFGANLSFRDEAGLASYPVDGSMLQDSRVIVHVYEPEEHFSRNLIIPGIRLRDWEAESAPR